MAGGTPTTYSDVIEQADPFGILFGGESRTVNELCRFPCPREVGDSQISNGARMERKQFDRTHLAIENFATRRPQKSVSSIDGFPSPQQALNGLDPRERP